MPRDASLIFIPLLILLAGCQAERTLTITSEPTGALVYLNGQEVGRTPMKYDFKWYSDYDIALRKEGYESLKTHRNLPAPVHMWPPFDLFSELMGVKDRRQWHFTMAPQNLTDVEPATLIQSAMDLREELRSSRYTRIPSTFPTTLPTPAPATEPAAE